MNGLPWYALRVRPRFEKMVASTLLMKGYEGFLPLYRKKSRWSDRIKESVLPFFPGYIFCRFDLNNIRITTETSQLSNRAFHGHIQI